MSNENPFSHSFVKIPSAKVAELAQNLLDWLGKERAETIKNLTGKAVEAAQEYKLKGWYYRFCNDNYVEMLESDLNRKVQYLKVHYQKVEEVAQKLLKASQY